ncbi:NAD-dependent epimerase/dehydratase family protein [Micromonospora zhanjiangensis]|uniref:NAD-dependent epimerase/dehydratase family protein n=1 Tax=Micromonospora zhanjiangensis TaxID=1522057 RepID=A0ABV8KWA9_9ACTN
MKLLVLGGTQYVGRAVVASALAVGWRVTVLHRGRHAAPPGVSVVFGDRTVADGLSGLAGGDWDAVVDTWSGAPVVVRDGARALAGRYAYVSSRSVYAYPAAVGAAEDAPVVDGRADDGPVVDYPRAKRGGELAVREVFGDRALLVRAGLILGPWENVGRLPWWLTRIARGGRVLAPGPPESGLQYVDVRDLADWTVAAARDGLSGPYNVVGPAGHATMRELLEACARVTGSDARLRWTDPARILAAGVEPWTQLPIWLPPGELYDSTYTADVSRAVAAGLRCRPVAETVADTWRWLRSLGGSAPQRPDRPAVGLAPEVERALLAS